MLTAIGLLPLALLGAWNIHAAGEYKEREQERWMLDLARALSSAVDAELDSAVTVLSSLSNSPSLQNNDLRAFHAVARRMVATQPDWLGVILTDDSGKILLRTMDEYGEPAPAVIDQGSLRQLLATGQPVAGGIVRGPRGRAAFPVRVLVSGAGDRRYTLSAVILPDRMVRLISRQQVPGNAVIAVRDGARRLVARSQNQERKVGGEPSQSLTELMRRAGPEGYGTAITTEGMRLATGYTTRSRYGWAVIVGQPVDSLRAAAFERMGMFGAGIVVSLLACVVAASLLSNRLVATIKSLQQNASALGSGAPLSLAPSAITEIEQIGQALEQAERQRTAQEIERAQLLDSLNRALASHQTALAEAREAGRAKDEFLAVLGHELRNPLSPIVTSLDLLDLRDEPSSRKERRVMRRQVNHLRRLVDDLLDVSRITSGKLQLDARAVNLADVVRHAVASLPGQPITLHAPDAVWVQGDDSRLAQVLNNLLSNAERFGSSATVVTLEAGATQARLTVSDNGIGMSEELIARVFEPFQQAPQSLARRSGGLGLGLAIVRKIVELHGGQVYARSGGAGAGSQFEVVLPLCAAPLEEAAATAPDHPAGMQLLLVDDNVDAALAGAALLELLGHEVRIAHTAAEALDQIRRKRPQVAILDIGLPDMDGYALATAIREETGDAALRLVALTGYGQKEDVARAYAAHFDLHLTKPASVADLQRATAPLPA
ncbi:signal transduction histidine kinase/CheY-like chemotaxis protein [Duganella sp. SG902]|uniref:hybrid sensor histidine kinase/response regulator n=1 Tax=Duganella sp. SG902 TaxID=2587016 RepID=UPI00184D33F9|nr:ATP-binding protein [Duganella sp. SG902]NVM78572.1 signal transduction histidine kinase/CheY-like chemotaxis protein [Duganella sp. SG902]